MLMDQKRQNIAIQPQHRLPFHLSSPSYGSSKTSSDHQPAFLYPGAPFHTDIDIDLDLDVDGDHGAQSLSSSPISTQSLLSQYSGVHSSPLSTFDSIPPVAPSRGPSATSLFAFSPQRAAHSSILAEQSASLFANTDSMQTDSSWLPSSSHLTPRTAARATPHQRESSLSSMGSNGPASPYSQNLANPQIALTDSADNFHGLPNPEDLHHYQLAKSYPSSVTHDNFYTSYPNYASAEHSAIASYPRIAAVPKRKNDRGLLPPDHLIGSRPVSVASSITSDSPATPAEEPEEHRRQRALGTVPKLERTMTDIYSDELYSPNFTITPASSARVPISPSSGLFAQRLQAANSQHLTTVQSPVSASSRNQSPFRHNSPLAAMPLQDFPAGFASAQQIREQNKAHEARAAQQQMGRSMDTSTPQTISPKDAMLEFHDADADANFPLFPQQSQQQHSNDFDMDAITKAVSQSHPAFVESLVSLDTNPFGNYMSGPQLSSGIHVPQQYPFISQARQQSSIPSLSNGSLATSRVGSAETGPDSSHVSSPQRPASTSADGGTYTCTYHGCTLRFDTPALLQKHKREGHRQAHGLSASRRADSVGAGMTTSLLNSQAGPHRCDRINPSTGKPCNTIFSRPYDLTRHEDTIHNARKQKVRCDLCTDEKTFSRADALTRHYRVCHPDVEIQGKHRRRAAQGS